MKTSANKSIFLHIGGTEYRIEISRDSGGYPVFDLYKSGASKPYHIHFHPDRYTDSELVNWGCSCKGWTMKKGNKPRVCKHLTALRRLILEGGF